MKPICSNPPCRWLIPALISAAVLFEGLPGVAAEPSLAFTNRVSQSRAQRPNIILIVADGLGYGDLSCYGQTKFQTPNLDRLAAGGMRFTGYYAGNAAGTPSRAALLVGRDPAHLRQRADADVPLAADEVTVASALKTAGYDTGLIGEWNFGDDTTSGAPWRKGFDEFAGYFEPADAKNYYADYMWRHAPRSYVNPTNNQMEDFVGREMLFPNTGGKKELYIPDLYTKAALNFCARYRPDKFRQLPPFFLLLNYRLPGQGDGVVPTDAPYSEEAWPQWAKTRAAMISRLDGYIGQLLEELQKPGFSNNTVVFFTSDTGPQGPEGSDPAFFRSAGPFRGGSGELYEGNLRVPMIAWWPGRIPAGQVSDFTWAAWDFLPTALDITGGSVPPGVDGISVWPVLQGQVQTNRHEFLHWELRGRNVWHTIRLGDWEAVQPKANAPLELYNLSTDPGETNNVAAQQPDVVRKIRDILKSDH